MSQDKERTILGHVQQARRLSDAFIVVGILPGGRVFYDCDDRISLPDLHGVLLNNVDFICESVARTRQARKQGGKR